MQWAVSVRTQEGHQQRVLLQTHHEYTLRHPKLSTFGRRDANEEIRFPVRSPLSPRSKQDIAEMSFMRLLCITSRER